MSRNRHNHHPQSVTPPVNYRNAKLFFVMIAGTCSITAAIVAFWKIFAPVTTTDYVLFVIAAVSIYVYGGIDTADKCKKWGLFKN